MKYELSQHLFGGEVVSLRKNKFIRASKYSKAVGVYSIGGIRKTLLLSGEKVETTIPTGIVYSGPVEAKVSKR